MKRVSSAMPKAIISVEGIKDNVFSCISLYLHTENSSKQIRYRSFNRIIQSNCTLIRVVSQLQTKVLYSQIYPCGHLF